MSQFNSEHLAEARAYNKMTGEELAGLIGVKKQAISQFENKKAEPDYGTVCKMSEVLKFPVSFFYEKTVSGLVGNTYFRAPFSSNKKDLNSQKIKTRYVAQIYGTLARYVDFWPYNVPEFKDTQNISSVAQRLRDYWGLGQEPIQDMISLMERNGIIMSEFATDTKKIDAFYQYGEIRDSAYHCVVLGTEKPSFVRRQFSAAHELGHIVLHEKFNDLDDASREDFRKREDEANEFAAEFLLPKTAFLNDLKMYPNKLTHYVELKRKWRVSIAAMVMRAYNLEAINQNQYQYLINNTPHTLFEKGDLVSLVESLRNEVVHNGTWELNPKIFVKFECGSPIERYMLFPDISQGHLATVKNRKHFFGNGMKVNEVLPKIHIAYQRKLLNTVKLLNTLAI